MDIDIDLPKNFNPSEFFNITYASMEENEELKKHPVGVYFQNIPVDKETGISAIPYKEAESIGYMKIDMLHLSLLEKFKNKKQIRSLIRKEPNWNLLKNEFIVKTLFHIGNHFDIVNKVNPTSVKELSDILALIRPGKSNLLDAYLKNPKETRKELYTKNINSDMRESHTIPYALLIVLQLHLIEIENDT